MFTNPKTCRLLLHTLYTLIFLLLVVPQAKAQDPVHLYPSKDNTLIEDFSGSFSNGAAEHFYSGSTGPQGDFKRRRALFHFDIISALPENAELLGATLILHVTRTNTSQTEPYTLYRLTGDWGEGTSNFNGGIGASSTPNDATWIHTFYDDQFWQTPGGDFISDPSATLDIGLEGAYSWQNLEGILDDIQFWMEHPEENFGWILIGNETENAHIAKQFGAREHPSPEQRPQLVIDFFDPALPVELTHFGGIVDQQSVYLHWETSSEQNNAGFEVQHEREGVFTTVGFVGGSGTTNESKSYSFQVHDLPYGQHRFRLKQLDFDGAFAYSPIELFVITLNDRLAKLDVFPTPFNPVTQISLTIQQPQPVTIDVYNILGQQVTRLHDGMLFEAGNHLFSFAPDGIPTGTYLIVAQGAFFEVTQPVVFLK